MLPKDSFAFKLFYSYYSGGTHIFCRCEEGSGGKITRAGPRQPRGWRPPSSCPVSKRCRLRGSTHGPCPVPIAAPTRLLFPTANGRAREPLTVKLTILRGFQKQGRPGAFSQQLGLPEAFQGAVKLQAHRPRCRPGGGVPALPAPGTARFRCAGRSGVTGERGGQGLGPAGGSTRSSCGRPVPHGRCSRPRHRS